MDYDIQKYLTGLIQEAGSIDIAEAEFKRNLADDDCLKDAYRRWCDEEGYSERSGYSDFFQEFIEGHNEMWNSLSDYDEDE